MGNDSGHGESQEGKDGIRSNDRERNGHQDVGKDDTEPNSQVHMEQPLGNAETVSNEESPSEVSQAAIFQNAGT